MAKHESGSKRSGDVATTTRRGPSKGDRRRIARLERELHRLTGQEERRVRRLTRTRDRARDVQRRLRELRSTGEATAHAYCLRDRRVVAMLDPRSVVLANGRAAIAGTCQACGGGIVSMVARAAAS
jgi:hypothetical protein